MKNSKEESHSENKHNDSERINYAPSHQTPILSTTSQMKVSPKIEITITNEQLEAVKWLFKQYGKSKPSWLRQKFYINQRRRKCLNVELTEAQLDRAFCNHYRSTNELFDLLHLLWHNINGELSCI